MAAGRESKTPASTRAARSMHRELATRLPANWALALLFLLATVPLTWSIAQLEVSNEAEDFLSRSDAAVQFEHQLRSRFPRNASLIAVFELGDEGLSDLFLDDLEQISEAMATHPLVQRLYSPTHSERLRGEDDRLRSERLLGRDERRGLTHEQRIERLWADPLTSGRLAATDGSRVALVMQPGGEISSKDQQAIRDAFKQSLAESRIAAERVSLTGDIAVKMALLDATLRDLWFIVPLSIASGLGLIAWMFRRWLAVAATLTITAASLGSGLAITALTGHAFTMTSAILIPLVIALAVALLVHWFNALTQQAKLGYTGHARVERAHMAIHRPALFTALTTATAFLSLSISPPPVSVFGQSAAAAVLVQYLAVLWLLPSVFARWDRHPWPVSGQGVNILERPIARVLLWAHRHPRAILGAALVVTLAGTPQILRIEIDASLIRFLPDQHPTLVATDTFSQHFHGTTAIDVVLIGQNRDAFKDPQLLDRVALFRGWLEHHPEVDVVRSMLEVLEELNWALHNEDPSFRIIPDNRELIAQSLLFYDRGELYDRVDRDFQIVRISVFLRGRGSKAVNEFAAEVEQKAAMLGWLPEEARVASDAYLLSQNERRILRGQLHGLILAGALIFLLLALLWRSFSRALVAMLPNLFPVLVILIVLGAFGLSLNVVTAMIAAIVLGVAVDDTIHLYHGYQQRRDAGLGHAQALLQTYRHAGRAITATTLILGTLMLWLVLSDFTPTSTFGLLISTGIVAAWVFDLLVLPAILTWLHEHRRVGRNRAIDPPRRFKGQAGPWPQAKTPPAECRPDAGRRQ